MSMATLKKKKHVADFMGERNKKNAFQAKIPSKKVDISSLKIPGFHPHLQYLL